MSKNSDNMSATIVQPSGAVTVFGEIESYGKGAITMLYRKKRSSKFKRRTFPKNIILAFGKTDSRFAKDSPDFLTYLGRVEVEEFVGKVDSTDGDFVVITTEAGKVNIRADAAEIESVADFDAPGGKKKNKKDKSEKKEKKNKKKK